MACKEEYFVNREDIDGILQENAYIKQRGNHHNRLNLRSPDIIIIEPQVVHAPTTKSLHAVRVRIYFSVVPPSASLKIKSIRSKV